MRKILARIGEMVSVLAFLGFLVYGLVLAFQPEPKRASRYTCEGGEECHCYEIEAERREEEAEQRRQDRVRYDPAYLNGNY